MLIWLITVRSRSRRKEHWPLLISEKRTLAAPDLGNIEHRPLLLSIPLSFRRTRCSVLACPCPESFSKPLNTSALPSCRPAVTSAVTASLSVHSVPPTVAWAGKQKDLLAGCLTSQQQASVSQGRICSDNFTCCHTEIEVADQTFYLAQSQYTDTGPTSPSADPITPGAWSASF